MKEKKGTIRYKVVSNHFPKIRASIYAGGIYKETYPVGKTRRAKVHTVGFLVFGTNDHAEMWIQELIEERGFKGHHLGIIQVKCQDQVEVPLDVPSHTSQENLDSFYAGTYRLVRIPLPEGTECWMEVTAIT